MKNKRILTVADKVFGEYIEAAIKGYSSNLEHAGIAHCVDEAIDSILNNNIDGVYLNSLMIPRGNSTRYDIDMLMYSDFEPREGGLFVLEFARNKGLVSVLGTMAENPEEISKAEELGAKVFEATRYKDIVDYFSRKLK